MRFFLLSVICSCVLGMGGESVSPGIAPVALKAPSSASGTAFNAVGAPAAFIPVDSMPIPPPDPKQLFYLQRTPNANTIICDININARGELDPDEPVHVFWLRYTENQHGAHAELNYIQRTFAYGIKTRKLAPEKYELHFVSFKKYNMYLMKAADRQYHVFSTINGKVSVLSRIYVQIHGGTFWSPHVEYVELKGTDPATGKEVMGRINV